MAVVGGLRSRLIRDSVQRHINDVLEELGWFSPNRQHLPLKFPATAVDNDVEIPLNTLALSDEDLAEVEWELGSTMVEHRWTYYLDFYAENSSLGKHLINDVRDALAGRMSNITGGTSASCAVLDLRMATPVELFRVQFEDFLVDRAHNFPKPWQKHWYSLRFTVLDHYGDLGT